MDYKQILYSLFHFEKKKLILPIISTLVILSFVAGVYDYRGHNYGQIQAEVQGSEEFNRVVADLEHEFFNSSFSHTKEYGEPTEEHLKEIQDQEWRNQLNEKFDLKNNPTRYLIAISGSTYRTPLFLLMPSNEATFYSAGLNREKSLIFPAASGYVFSKDAFYSELEWNVKGTKLARLSEEINRSRYNWSLNKFRNEVEEIRSEEVGKQETSEWLESMIEEQPDSRSKRLAESIQNKIDKDQITRISFVHFIPAIIVNFGIYYLISGIMVFIYREFTS